MDEGLRIIEFEDSVVEQQNGIEESLEKPGDVPFIVENAEHQQH